MKIYERNGVPEEIMLRARADVDAVKEKVADIIRGMKQRGDDALREYTERFDGVRIEDFEVGRDEIEAAYEKVAPEVLDAMKKQVELSKKFALADFENLSKELNCSDSTLVYEVNELIKDGEIFEVKGKYKLLR